VAFREMGGPDISGVQPVVCSPVCEREIERWVVAEERAGIQGKTPGHR
jgi:hypothetical protein